MNIYVRNVVNNLRNVLLIVEIEVGTLFCLSYAALSYYHIILLDGWLPNSDSASDLLFLPFVFLIRECNEENITHFLLKKVTPKHSFMTIFLVCPSKFQEKFFCFNPPQFEKWFVDYGIL